MTVTRTFLPWYRRGFAASLVGSPASGARAALPANVTLREYARTTTIPAQLAGPGDVVGLDSREVLRLEPFDGATDFEPAYFAYIELSSPDLPWRFSPFGAETASLHDPEHTGVTVAQSLVRPWLMLVVVAASAASIRAAPSGGLPVLSTDAAQLPDPAEAWAWAHVQVVTADGQSPQAALTDPSRALARLICPQRLDKSTRYIACLVPTFAAGREALVPTGSNPPPLGPAWGRSGPIQLPVYFQWSFTTGQAGSFETYARRLKPTSTPASMSGRTVATDHPGWGATGGTGATTVMQGALRPFGTNEPDPPDATLSESIRAAISASGSGVQLKPPMYGQHYQGGVTAIAQGAHGWLAQLNTDVRRRTAAGLAAWAITVEQEDLVDRASQQLGGTASSTRMAASVSRLASAVGASLDSRHFTAALSAAPPPLARLARAGGPWSSVGAAAVGFAAIGSAISSAAMPAATSPATTRFTPVFVEPAYALLRAVAPEWLLPGSDDIPEESILLVRSNPRFVEAFMVGLNHALGRELAWRRYPIEPTGTMFRNFWASARSGSFEFPAIADWPAGSDLGTHSSSPDQLVLLVRGQLLRRFPTAVLYLSRTHPDGSEVHLTPGIGGVLSSDISFFGFPITPGEALHPSDTQPAGTTGWSIVIQEGPQHTRFGVEDPGASPTPLQSWQDLNWSHAHLKDKAYVAIADAGGSPSNLLGISRPIAAGGASTATWGASSGHLAVILQRPAFRIRIPVGLWLNPLISARS